MRDMNLFDQSVQEVQANADRASNDALSAMQELSYIDLDSRKDNLTSQIKERHQQEINGFADGATNLGKRFAEGGLRTIGSMINAGIGLGVTDLSNVPQEALDAYSKVSHYKEAGITDLKTFKSIYGDDPKYADDLKAFELLDKPYQTEDGLSVNATPLGNQIETALKANDTTQAVKEFFKNAAPVAKTGARTEFDSDVDEVVSKDLPQLKQGFQQLKDGSTWEGINNVADAATSLVFGGVKTGLDNPFAVGEYIAENIPSMLGKKIATTSNVGYGTEVLNQAIADYRKENNGNLPSKSRLEEMKAWATAAAGAEQLGDMFILGKGKTNLPETIARPSSAMMKATKGLGTPVAKPIGSFVSESSTEGFQTYVEDSAINNKKADPHNIIKSGIIGGLVGTGLSTGVEVLSKGGKATKATGKAVADATIVGGDALAGKLGVTRNLKERHKEDVIIKEAETSGDETKINDMLKNIEKESAKGAIGIGKKIANSNVSIDAKQAANEAVTKSLNKEVDLYQQLMDEANSGTLSNKRKKELKKQELKVEALRVSAEPIKQAATIGTKEMDELMLELGKGTSSSKAAKRIFNSFKANNDSVTEEQLDKLVESGNLTANENQQINSYKLINGLVNTLSGTKKEVIEGGFNKETKRYNFGLKDYRNMVMSGNVAQGLAGLKKFADIHTAKAERLEQDFEKFKATGKRIDYPDGSYVNANSGKMIAEVRKEANVLNQSYAELSKIKNSNIDDIETNPTEDASVSTNTIVTKDGSLLNPDILKDGSFAFQKNILAKAGINVTTQAQVDNIIENGYAPLEEIKQESVKPKNKLKSKIQTVPSNNPVVNVIKHNKNTYKVFKDGSAINVKTNKKVRNKQLLVKLNKKNSNDKDSTDTIPTGSNISVPTKSNQVDSFNTSTTSNKQVSKADTKQILSALGDAINMDGAEVASGEDGHPDTPKMRKVFESVISGESLENALITENVSKEDLRGFLTSEDILVYPSETNVENYSNTEVDLDKLLGSLDNLDSIDDFNPNQFEMFDNGTPVVKKSKPSKEREVTVGNNTYVIMSDKSIYNKRTGTAITSVKSIRRILDAVSKQPEGSLKGKTTNDIPSVDSTIDSTVQESKQGQRKVLEPSNSKGLAKSVTESVLLKARNKLRSHQQSKVVPTVTQTEPSKDTGMSKEEADSYNQYNTSDDIETANTDYSEYLNEDLSNEPKVIQEAAQVIEQANSPEVLEDRADVSYDIEEAKKELNALLWGSLDSYIKEANNIENSKPKESLESLEGRASKIIDKQVAEVFSDKYLNNIRKELIKGNRVFKTKEELDLAAYEQQNKELDKLYSDETMNQVIRSIAKPIKTKEQIKEIAKDLLNKEVVKITNQLKALQDYQSGKSNTLPKGAGKYSLAKSVVEQPNDDTKFIGSQNLISKYFKVGNNRKSVLDKTRNFMSKLMKNPYATLAESHGELSENNLDVLDSFSVFHDKFVAALDDQFYVNTKEDANGRVYNQQDYTQSLTIDGKLPENVKTAMAAAAYQWLMANGKKSTIKSEERIRDILNLTEDDYLPRQLHTLFNQGGMKVSDVINNIGLDAMRTLNLKVEEHGLEHSETNLAHALGSLAVVALKGSKYLKTHSDIKKSKVTDLYGKELPEGVKELGDYIRLVSAQNINTMTETNIKSPSFISDIFGTQREKSLPDVEVPKVNDTKTKTNQKITPKTEDTLAIDQARGSTLNTSLIENLEGFDNDLLLSMAGFNHDVDNSIKALKDSEISKNNSIKEALDIFNEMKAWVNINEGLDTIFHYAHNVWKNDRMGLNNSFNPQSSKLHRYLQHRVDWETEVNLSDSTAVNWFKLAVAQGFDIVADKNSDADTLAKFNQKIADPIIRAGIDAMKARINRDTSIETQQKIADAVIKGGEKFATLNALQAYAEYEIAVETDGIDTFSHAMAREVDGITNGVAITFMQFAQDNLDKMFKVLNRMGFFRDGKSFPQFNKEGNQDSYKTLAKSWNDEIKNSVPDNLKEAYTAAQQLIGSFVDSDGNVTDEGRKLAKPPLMQTIYGASIQSIIESIGMDGVDKVYKNIQKSYKTYLKNGSKNDKAFLKEVNNQLALFSTISGIKQKELTTVKEAINFEFKTGDIDLFLGTITSIYSDSLTAAMQKDYAQVFEVRTQVNNAANLMTTISSKLFEKRKKEIIAAKLKANPDLPKIEQVLTLGEKNALLKEMKHVMPYVNTASSFLLTPSGDNLLDRQLESALYLPKRNTSVITDGTADVVVRLKGNKEGKNKSITTKGTGTSIGSAGVGTIPILTHTQDALVQLIQMRTVSGLNVHDAYYMGSKNYTENQQQYNKALMFVLKNYNPVLEVSRTLDRVLAEVSKHPEIMKEIFESEAGQKYLKNLAGELKEGGNGAYTYRVLDKNLSVANVFKKAGGSLNVLGSQLQTNKLNVINELTNVEQYRAGDGGAFNYPKLSLVNPTTQASRIFNNIGSVPNLASAVYTINKDVDSKSLVEVFEFMKDESIKVDSSEHLEHLSKIVSDVGVKVVEPFNLQYGTSESSRTVGSLSDSTMRIINTVEGSTTPSALLGDGNMSAAEVFTHELVHSLTRIGLSINTMARGQVNKLWLQAKNNKKLFNPEMFLPEGITKTDPNYKDELKIATNKYQHIFEIRAEKDKDGNDILINGKRVSNHLDEFVTYGMTNAKFRKALSQVKYSTVKRREGNSLTDNLYNAFGKMIDSIYTLIIGSKGKTADKQLNELFRALSNVDSKNKAKIKNVINKIGSPVIKTKEGFSKAIDPVSKFASKHGSKLTKPTVTTATTLWEVLGKEMHSSTNKYINGMAKVLTEADGRTTYNGIQHDIRRLAQKEVDQEREAIRITTAEVLSSKFKQKITKEIDKVLFKVIGKTDLVTLRNLIGSADMEKAITSKKHRDSLIKQYTMMLNDLSHGSFYVEQAINLGKFMVTGNNGLPKGLMNSLAISELAGTKFKRPINARATAKDIDVLASLIALDTVASTELNSMAKLLKDENKGIHFSLDLMKKFQEDSDKDFEENPYSKMKGYMRDMTDPDIDVVSGYAKDREAMEAKGYIMKDQLWQDDADPSKKPRFLFVNTHGGKAAFLQGNMYMKSDKAKGTDVIGAMLDDDPEAFKKMNAIKNKQVAVKGRRYTVPVINSEGNIVGYRYIMNETAKTNYLGNKPSFIDSISMMRGDIAVKANMKNVNKQVVDALAIQYKEDFAKNSEMYITISPFHPDEKIREIYAMLPKDAKEYAAQAFNGLPMVRKDQLDLLFGYRKYSIRETLAKNPEDRTALTNVMVTMLTKLFGGTPKMWTKVVTAENVIQELVKYVKDVIVIRSAIVTIGNTYSNLQQLWLSDVPIKKIITDYADAFEGYRKYKKYDKERRIVALKLKDSSLTKKVKYKLEKQLIMIESELSNNPLSELIDSGVLPNIVEDVSERVDSFSMKGRGIEKLSTTKLVNKGIKFVEKSKIAKPALKVGKEVLAMEGSQMHKMLTDAAMFSDFGARYVLYKHLTKDIKDDPKLSKKENEIKEVTLKNNAMGRVMQEFINYDLPTERSLQYLNDMGILMFTKYLIRIQKVILNMFTKNAGSIILKLMAMNMLDFDTPDIIGSNLFDKGILNNFHNPVESLLSTPSTIYSHNAVSSML